MTKQSRSSAWDEVARLKSELTTTHTLGVFYYAVMHLTLLKSTIDLKGSCSFVHIDPWGHLFAGWMENIKAPEFSDLFSTKKSTECENAMSLSSSEWVLSFCDPWWSFFWVHKLLIAVLMSFSRSVETTLTSKEEVLLTSFHILHFICHFFEVGHPAKTPTDVHKLKLLDKLHAWCTEYQSLWHFRED